MANPWVRKAKKPSLKGLAKDNGKPSLAALTKGKPTLRALVSTTVATERPYQAPKPRVKEDFRHGGILFSGAEVTGEITAGYRDGMFRPIGSVDVTNGDLTFTLHNRYGSWMHDVWQGGGRMAEPARVAAWLGLSMSQLDMAKALTQRFEVELKKRGIPTTHQQRARLEAQAAAKRKRTKQPETTNMTTKKINLRGLGKR